MQTCVPLQLYMFFTLFSLALLCLLCPSLIVCFLLSYYYSLDTCFILSSEREWTQMGGEVGDLGGVGGGETLFKYIV